MATGWFSVIVIFILSLTEFYCLNIDDRIYNPDEFHQIKNSGQTKFSLKSPDMNVRVGGPKSQESKNERIKSATFKGLTYKNRFEKTGSQEKKSTENAIPEIGNRHFLTSVPCKPKFIKIGGDCIRTW